MPRPLSDSCLSCVLSSLSVCDFCDCVCVGSIYSLSLVWRAYAVPRSYYLYFSHNTTAHKSFAVI